MSDQYRRSDSIGGAVGIDTGHAMVHAGRLWRSNSTILAVAAAGNTDFLFRNSTNEAHVLIHLFSDKRCDFRLYENPNVTAAGTACPPLNMDRDSPNTTAVTCFRGSTIAAVGTFLDAWIVGDAAGAGSHGGGIREGNEWIFLASEDYLIRATTAAVNTDILVRWTFYEEI